MIRLEIIFCWFFAFCRCFRDLICYKYSMFLLMRYVFLFFRLPSCLAFFMTLESGKWKWQLVEREGGKKLKHLFAQRFFAGFSSSFLLAIENLNLSNNSNGIKIMSNIHITRVWSAEKDLILFVFLLNAVPRFAADAENSSGNLEESRILKARNEARKWENLNKTNDLN